MNDERFLELAMKALGRQATDGERAELEAMVAKQPELRTEFDRLQSDARLVKKVVPLVSATGASSGEFPAYARERLQTKVRQMLRETRRPSATSISVWRWIVGLAAVAAVVVVVLLQFHPPEPRVTIQVAVLDLGGATRGNNTNDLGLLIRAWNGSPLQRFATAGELEAWSKAWPAGANPSMTKVVYDRASAEIRVQGKWRGQSFEKIFPVEGNLPIALDQVQKYIREQTGDAKE